ncbi:unnamed protein product [Polarella glacialis]|uniref:Anaphase-promoting complex subunit 11 n=1 Tax=Polarella glacialis TaxID=89957 RepID=A0A813GTJ2_POLGL|nr:unnamed protein product [Polarella glacialis]
MAENSGRPAPDREGRLSEALSLTPQKRRSSRLREALLDGRCGFSPRAAPHDSATDFQQCGACLLEVDTAGDDGEFVALLDSCQPRHCFHIRCIFTWAEQENSCPQCKKRFSRIGVYSKDGELLRVSQVQEKDQNFDEASEEGEEQECLICHRSHNDSAMLLCDGQGGSCTNACHYFCVGLPGVPEGDWFCPPCESEREQPRRLPAAAARAGKSSAASSQATSPSRSPVAASGLHGLGQQAATQITASQLAQPVRIKQEPIDDEVEPARSSSSAASPRQPLPSRVKQELPPDPPKRNNKRAASGRPTGSSSALTARSGVQVPVHVQVQASSPSGKTLISDAEQPPSPSSQSVKAEELSQSRPGRRSSATGSGSAISLRASPQASSSSAASSSGSAAFVKRLPGGSQKAVPLGEACGGLCSEMPKWISRQGRVVKVDLGGRNMRDPVAVILAQVVQAALKQVMLGADSLSVSMLLAGNRLRKAGIAALLLAVKANDLHVSHLDLDRNKLDAEAAEWLAGWLERQTGGPPSQIFLSQNRAIGEVAAYRLLQALGRSSAASNRLIPVWVEARNIGICSIDAFMDRLSVQFQLCLGFDRTICGPGRCVACEGEVSERLYPSLHLCGILEQDILEAEEKREQTKQELKPEKKQVSSTKQEIKTEDVDFTEEQDFWGSFAEGIPAKEEINAEGASSQHGDVGPEEPEVRPEREEETEEAEEAEQETRRRARGRGRGRGRRGPEPAVQAGLVEGLAMPPAAGLPPHLPPPQLPPELVEREERRSWAESLGKALGPDGYQALDLASPPAPSSGMWDVVRAMEKSQKRRKLQPLKALQQEPPKTRPSPVTPPNVKGAAAPVVSRWLPQRLPSAASQKEKEKPFTESHLEAWVPMAWVPDKAPKEKEKPMEAWAPMARVPDTAPTPPSGATARDATATSKGPEEGFGGPKGDYEERDYESLRKLVAHRLQKESQLWRGLADYERRLRRKCLSEQLSRMAWDKYIFVVLQSSSAGTWEAYLNTSKGHQRIHEWMDKKLRDLEGKTPLALTSG